MGTISYFNRIIKRPSLIFNENFLLHPVSSLNTSRQIINNNFDLVESVKRLTNESDENIKKYYESISKNLKLLDHLKSEFAKLDEYVNRQYVNSNFLKDNPATHEEEESKRKKDLYKIEIEMFTLDKNENLKLLDKENLGII